MLFSDKKRLSHKGESLFAYFKTNRFSLAVCFCCFVFSYSVSQFRQDLLQIANDTQVSYFKNRSGFVLVDSDDQFGVFHTCNVLDIQHVAGMENSELIIAINKNESAPIFEVADLGIVGDLKQILPKLADAVRKYKAAKANS